MAESVDPGAVRERDELWSILDWTLWGNGMADTFREPIADKMCAALTDDERAQALSIIAAWQERRGPHAMHPAREEIARLQADNADLRQRLAMAEAARDQWIGIAERTAAAGVQQTPEPAREARP